MRYNVLKYSLFLFAILSVNKLFAFTDWELIAEKDNIKVYAKPDAKTGFNIYKAVMVVDASEDRVVEVLKDIKNYNKWTPRLDDTQLLKSINNNEFYYYSTVSAPMVSSRDMVVHLKTFKTGNATVVKMNGAPNLIPQKKGFVRMPLYSGTYVIEPTFDNKVAVSLEYQADPGGNLPKWIVNNNTDKVPMEMFLNLKAIF